MSFWGAGRRAGAVVAALLLVAGCSNAEAEDPGESSPSASAEASETPVGTSAEAAQDGGASAEAAGSTSGDNDSAPPSPDPNRPEAQLPERPAAMDEHTVEGAIAAGKYFVQLYPYIYATGDLSEWNELSGKSCKFCAGAKDHVVKLHESGGFVRGGTVTVSSEDGGGPYDNGVYIVELGVQVAPSTDVHGDGSTKDFDGTTFPNFTISLTWDNSSWTVSGVLLSPDSGAE